MSVYMEFAVKKEGDEPASPPLFAGRAPFDDGQEHIDPYTFEPYTDKLEAVRVAQVLDPWLIKSARACFADSVGDGRLYVALQGFPGRSRAQTYVACAAYESTDSDEGFSSAAEQLKEGIKRLGASISSDKAVIVLAMPEFMSVHRFRDDAMIQRCRVRFLTVDKAEAQKFLSDDVISPYAEELSA